MSHSFPGCDSWSTLMIMSREYKIKRLLDDKDEKLSAGPVAYFLVEGASGHPMHNK